MKVLMLHTSRRKGNTYQLLEQIQTILEKKQIEVEILSLHEYHIRYCVGCEACLLQGKCHIQDDVETILQKCMDSDGIILSSPVYLKSVSGILKAFVDRTCSWYHRPVLFQKPLLVVATTKGSGLKQTLTYLDDIGVQWGMHPCGKIGRTIVNLAKPITEKECANFISALQDTQAMHRPPMRSIINFQVQKALALYLGGLDAQYWKKMQWDQQHYYYACQISLFKKMVGSSLFRILHTVMKPQEKS